MNTYRVIMCVQGGRRRVYDVDACNPGVAIGRALKGLTKYYYDVNVSSRIRATNIDRHYSDPKVREV